MYTLTEEDLKTLEKRYGNIFYKLYKKEVLAELDRRKKIETKLKQSNSTSQNNNRYGHLLDKYIK